MSFRPYTALLPHVLVLALVPSGIVLEARQPAPAAVATRERANTAPEVPPLQDERAAEDTRRTLHEMLDHYPPSLREVLRLDPSLLTSEAYLASYPSLQAYLAGHPEVAHNPAYFVGEPQWRQQDNDPGGRAIRMWENTFEAMVAFSVFLVVTSVLVWFVRALVDYRRWVRVSRVQADAHAKLLDRLTSNEELLTYVQTSAGRRFLESAPLPLDESPKAFGAPFGRILWSVQAGLVLGFAGAGLQFASGRVAQEVAPPLLVVGIVALAIGIGFVASAVVAYVMSRRAGLLEPAPMAKPADGHP